MLRRLTAALLLGALLGLAGAWGAGLARAEAGVDAVAPAVLVLASYHQGDAWTDQVLAGLLADLKSADPALVPAVEYLDTKRFPGPEHQAFLKETLARKYRDRPPALVIALDNPALDLLRTHPRDLFPETPVVFAGINGFRPEWLRDRPAMTGVAEVEDMAGTLALAQQLHPGARRVLVVDDDTASGRAVRRDMETILPGLPGHVAVEFAPAVPFPELARQLAALPPDSLVLILTYVTDAAGRVFSREEGTRLIAAAAPVPVYAMHATRLGHGIVGGLLLDGREHGAQAAALARRVLAGEDPAQIPVQPSRSYPRFDARQLRRFHIAATALPPDSRIINRPETFYSQYRRLVLGTLAVLALLSLAVLVLSVAVLRVRRAGAALHQAEEQTLERTATQKAFYEDILERVQEGIFVTDAQQRITYANQSMARIAGVAVADLIGRHAVENFPPETVRDLRPLLHQAMASRAPTPWELRLVTPAGRDAWQAGWLLPWFGAAGYAGMICTVRDITAERTAELALQQHREQLEETVAARTAALRAAQEHLRLILESSASGLCGLTPNGTVDFANPAACRLLGYPVERLVGAAFHPLIHHSRPDGSHYPAAECPMGAALRDGRTVTVDSEVFWRADGQAIPVIYSAHPMVRDGAIVGAVVSFLDLSERRRLEERLRRLAAAVEGIAGVRDLAGLAAIVCAAARRLTGADGASLVLRDAESCEYVGEDAISPLWAGRRFPLDDSAAGWVIRHAAPLTLDDIAAAQQVPPDLFQGTFVRGLCVVPIGRTQPLGAIGCYWAAPHCTRDTALDLAQALADATAVGLANLDLIGRLTEARAVAERLAQVKSLFLANMSHEIRTPMNAIVGLAHLLHRGTRDPDQQDKLGKITAAANHLLAIINDILDFSKIEAGKLELAQCDFDLAQVLRRACTLVADQARAKGLELALQLDPALAAAPGLRGDPTRLTQLLLNYLANAVKFTAQGTITLEAVILADDPDTRLLRFSVRDTGPGIAAADQGRLFDAFEQLDPSTTRRHGGTGLGLAINRRLAELMGGGVGVESRPGAGSTFWFTVRLGRGTPARSDAVRSPDPAVGDATDAAESALRRGYRGTRVLLAEDNPINQEVALELLRGAGLQTDLAADGAAALALARATPYDLILMDVQMPVLDGLEATAAIRALPGHAATPILALTANAFGEDRARCLAAGMNDHVGKPVDPADLFAALLRWLPPGAAAPVAETGRDADAGTVPAAAAASPTPSAAALGEASTDAGRLARLDAIPGLDSALALYHVGGRTDRLLRLLRIFADSNRDDPARLRECLDSGDGAGAQRIAHSLKGAAATLGATRVQAQALELELALREGRPRVELEPRIERLDKTLAGLLGALRAVLDAEAGP